MTDTAHRPILIAYDGSACADLAIDKVAEEFGPRKVIVLVVSEGLERIPFFGTAGVPVEPETMELLTDAAEKGVERARALGLDATVAVAEGGPNWSAIVEAADEYDAAVIALGSRGLSGVKHALLGSVSGAVAHHSHRSVFIVHSA